MPHLVVQTVQTASDPVRQRKLSICNNTTFCLHTSVTEVLVHLNALIYRSCWTRRVLRNLSSSLSKRVLSPCSVWERCQRSLNTFLTYCYWLRGAWEIAAVEDCRMWCKQLHMHAFIHMYPVIQSCVQAFIQPSSFIHLFIQHMPFPRARYVHLRVRLCNSSCFMHACDSTGCFDLSCMCHMHIFKTN